MASANAILSSASSSTYLSFVFLLLITTILTSAVHLTATSNAPTYLYTYCPNTTNYFAGRDFLLSNLVLSNNHSMMGFLSASVVGPDLPVYGISMCRGDVSESMCFTCVSTAASTLPKNCPYGIQGLIWYDECMIRYSPSSLGRLDKGFTRCMANTQNITGNLTQFNEILGSTSYDVAVEAAKGGELRKFATKEATYDDSQSIFVLGQCTPELSQTDCETCLKECVGQFPTCCMGKQGGRVISQSCYIRYEIYSFYYKSWVRTPAPVPAPPPMRNGASSRGN